MLTFGEIPALPFAVLAFVTFVIAAAIGSLQFFRAQLAERDYGTRAAGLPTISELRAAEQMLEVKRREELDLNDKLVELRREQAEAERHRLDAQHWQGLAEQAERDYEAKGDKIREIDNIRAQYEEAAKDLAERRSEINEAITDRDRLFHELEDLKARRAEAEALDTQIAGRRTELEAIRNEVAQLEDQREQLLRARFEVDQLARRKTELEDALLRLPKEVEELALRKAELARAVDELKDSRSELRAAKDEVDRLVARKLELSTEIDSLQREYERLSTKVAELTVAATRSREGRGEADDEASFGDLFRKPSCLDVPLVHNRSNDTNEAHALERVRTHLQALSLQFDDKLINRFHTCLKTGRITPLTVLAGISGTGKSQLSQRYAEAMGIPFLKVAVQPRWDSPQDLLGFYNYLEQSYKATDLARALVYMDGRSKFDQVEQIPDRMMLVLLDEMNIARVEYYFSEFLSRLEGRVGPDEDDESALLPGRLEIEIPNRLLSVYPGHNVLFVGTMNEDESTQALSDKVMDRSNIIRFKRPENLVSSVNQNIGSPSTRYLPSETWLEWHREPNALSGPNRTFIEDFVSSLNAVLEKVHRPFGHRVNQAIFSYAANHPEFQSQTGPRTAVADMLRMRVLPKLRGVELETHGDSLRNVAELISTKLGDDPLAASVRSSADSAASTVFNWVGD